MTHQFLSWQIWFYLEDLIILSARHIAAGDAGNGWGRYCPPPPPSHPLLPRWTKWSYLPRGPGTARQDLQHLLVLPQITCSNRYILLHWFHFLCFFLCCIELWAAHKILGVCATVHKIIVYTRKLSIACQDLQHLPNHHCSCFNNSKILFLHCCRIQTLENDNFSNM